MNLLFLFFWLVLLQIGVSRDPVDLANSSVAFHEALFALMSLFVAFMAISKIISFNRQKFIARENMRLFILGVIYIVVLLEATVFLASAVLIGRVVRIESDDEEKSRALNSLSQTRLLVEATNTFGLEYPVNGSPFFWIDGTQSEIEIARNNYPMIDEIFFGDRVSMDFFLAPCVQRANISISLENDSLAIELNKDQPVKRIDLGNVDNDLLISVTLIESPTCTIPGDGRPLSVGFSRPRYE